MSNSQKIFNISVVLGFIAVRWENWDLLFVTGIGFAIALLIYIMDMES